MPCHGDLLRRDVVTLTIAAISAYRRYLVAGGPYFFTAFLEWVLMERRSPLFADAAVRRLLESVFRHGRTAPDWNSRPGGSVGPLENESCWLAQRLPGPLATGYHKSGPLALGENSPRSIWFNGGF